MRKYFLALTYVVAVPFVAEAADLGLDYNFIQDNAPVQPSIVGHLQLGLGYFDESPSPPDEYNWLFEGAGRGNVEVVWANVELEFAGDAAFGSGGTSTSSIGLAGHIWGGTDNVAFGVVGNVIFPSGDILYAVGAEAEVYLGSVTLGTDFRYFWDDSCCAGDFWLARGWAGVYVTPNARIGGRVDYASYDGGVEEWFGSVTGEYRFAGTPISGWIEGTYLNVDASGSTTETWAGLVGIRVFMDAEGTTLHEHDKLVPWQSLNSLR